MSFTLRLSLVSFSQFKHEIFFEISLYTYKSLLILDLKIRFLFLPSSISTMFEKKSKIVFTIKRSRKNIFDGIKGTYTHICGYPNDIF